ncbi:MAG: hypothetical protein B7Z08_05315 [Sphingomonadales bacterium 32-68-7]|nr:MAG: hypothetical protein B7Z33_00890 [Sphingomonadales bacterium 12-68-11]OYX09420.1 MAG: hypothetical protein B7Z08_05315 [Sphingomonadales bacterium 32-68-7]
MARTEGARDALYHERRLAMIRRLRARLGEPGATHASWRELAAAAGVGLSTLAHYFGRRDDVVKAVMEQDLADGAEPLAVMAAPSGPFGPSVRDAVGHLAAGLSHGGLSRTYATGLVQCLRHPSLGPAFLDTALEPTLRAVEARLQAHVERGEMAGDPRSGALMLVSPLLMAHLHQTELGGLGTRALDLDAFCEDVAERFIRAYAV